MKKALIFGVSGQDGAYLAKLLLSKGYTVYGTSRDAQVSTFRNLEYLGIQQQVQLLPSRSKSIEKDIITKKDRKR
jgi:GDPmannose 4,6-dehydratase